jgi:hypothetical protein
MGTVREQILEELDHLTPDQQAHLLALERPVMCCWRRVTASPSRPATWTR